MAFADAQIAQLVEQRTENPRVTGSIPVLGTYKASSIEYLSVWGFFVYAKYGENDTIMLE